MIEFNLPSLGADMDEGTLLEWRIKPGDTVKRGQVVAVVDTSKAAVDVEIWHEGVVHALTLEPGQKVPVGTTMAILREAGESAGQVEAMRKQRSAAKLPPLAAHVEPGTAAVSAPHREAPAAARRPVSPAARRHAQELHVELEGISGSGPHGSVTVADVDKAAAAHHTAPLDRKAEMRRAIAAAMGRSKREIPHYYLSQDIPMQRAVEWLLRENEKHAVTERLLLGVLQLKAVALALARTPELNGFWRGDRFEPGAGVHVGVAISLRQGGLVAPAIHDVDRKSLVELMGSLADLVQRARAGSMRSSEMSDPTITVTNLGEQGAGAVFGVIYPPQVALVGFGRVADRPWIDDTGAVRALPVVTASLSGDHRVSDGIRGARFLTELHDRLQRPEEL
ncbi:MAG: branched-chain alpha-keto acid dehydrogenase subunit E2 [Gammaproteobacteria bacterium RIFCSPLOWO2_02_FULL_61_13]|nr:MAG: branched-chain alpha-keto acid dehydrogenase subunit E2 [Gammaproteobacteria bacterium RIFCSPLOWO2_02_FULL_61_13]